MAAGPVTKTRCRISGVSARLPIGLPAPALLSPRIFFFQAEDGIRDYKVTGVQTCALPIFKDTDPLPSSVRAQYTAKYGSLVDEGIAALKKAIELRPDYDDAMAYLNLM